jgi:hypothetical protein
MEKHIQDNQYRFWYQENHGQIVIFWIINQGWSKKPTHPRVFWVGFNGF